MKLWFWILGILAIPVVLAGMALVGLLVKAWRGNGWE